MVFGSIVAYFIISILRQQRKNIELNRNLVLSEINAIEKDRTRIAYDLHDELGGMISSIKLKINNFEIKEPEDIRQLGIINYNIDKAIGRIREISYNLMPTVLINDGLKSAIIDYINTLDAKLQIIFNYDDDISFNEQQSINIFRIMQEGINNAIKHSNATMVTISFEKKNDKLIISIQDNGIGFDVKNSSQNGVGLKSLYSRSQLLNGKLYIESTKERGSGFIFELPY